MNTKRMKRMKERQKWIEKANAAIDRWTAKGYTPEEIIDGLWNWRTISAEYRNGTYRVQIGGYGTEKSTWTHKPA